MKDYAAHCINKQTDNEFSFKYKSKYRNKSKENKADAESFLKEYCEQNNIELENVAILSTENITKRWRSERTKTSPEAKRRYEEKTYKKYVVRLRYVDDAELIDFIDSMKENGTETTEIFRNGLIELKNKKK